MKGCNGKISRGLGISTLFAVIGLLMLACPSDGNTGNNIGGSGHIPAALVGRWYMDATFMYEFSADGRILDITGGDSGFRMSISGDTITVFSHNTPVGMANFIFSGNTLIISNVTGTSGLVAGVHLPPDITYTVAVAGSIATTSIEFTFARPVSGLTADHIAVTNRTGSVNREALSGAGTSWSLAVTAITTGEVRVQINKGGIENTQKTVRVSAMYAITSVSNGRAVIDGSLWAWGRNQMGQLGNGTLDDSQVPIRIGADTNWVKVSAGATHTVGLRSDGSLWAWGSNNWGQLGDGTGGIIDWGNNRLVPTYSLVPIRIDMRTDWAYVSAGRYQTMAIREDGSLWAWGRNDMGSLGDGATTTFGAIRTRPVRIGTATNWASVSTCGSGTMAIRTDGTLWAWGESHFLGFDSSVMGVLNRPRQIGIARNWAAVSTRGSSGFRHTVAIRTDGSLWAWGNNREGQLGDDTVGYRSLVPIRIGTDTDWQHVSAGGTYTMAIRTDGSLWAWGLNSAIRLGGATLWHINSPTRIGTATDWTFVLGGGTTLGVRDNRSLWAWGSEFGWNDFVGDGNMRPRPNPVRIMP